MHIKRLISGVVACAMIITAMPAQAFASYDDSTSTTWTKELSADALYELVQDQLNEDSSISLEQVTEVLATDTNSEGTEGQLTTVAFDDQKIVLAELEDSTSYTLTFADSALSETPELPENTAGTGETVVQPEETVTADPQVPTQQTTGPPTTEEGKTLTVTEEETFSTETEAASQAQQ